MIIKYLAVHKRKHIVKDITFKDAPDFSQIACYWVKFEFEKEENIILPPVNGEGLKFVLIHPLTKKEFETIGLVKTQKEGVWGPVIPDTEKEIADHNSVILQELNVMDNGLKIIRMIEDELDGKCSNAFQSYIEKKKQLRANLK